MGTTYRSLLRIAIIFVLDTFENKKGDEDILRHPDKRDCREMALRN